MAFQQNYVSPVPAMHLVIEGGVAQKEKSNQTPSENLNGCFDCNICLDPCHDPVVTLCGHLYCWPCIYKWLQIQTTSFESDCQPKCPVCKNFISTSSLVPLYGGGRSTSKSDAKKPQLDLTIPLRPPAGTSALLAAAAAAPFSTDSNQRNNSIPFQAEEPDFRSRYISHPLSNHALTTPPTFGSPTTSTFNPTINMVSEMLFAGMFGGSETNLFVYPHQNSYHIVGNGSPRLRRQEMQLDKSLNRVSLFLFCCIALCLILF